MKIRNSILAVAGAFALAIGLSGAAAAGAPGANTSMPGAVNVSVGGINGNVTINTQLPYAQDTFNLQAVGPFSVDQTNRFVATGQYNGDGNDIDRLAAFGSGPGTITTNTVYKSTDPYSVGASNLSTALSATDSGGLQENLHFDQNQAGVFTQDQWKKQRSLQMSTSGAATWDVNNVGASIAPSLGSFPTVPPSAYLFDVNASTASGTTNLLFSPGNGSQALSNQSDHSHYTGVSLNGQVDFTGAPVFNVNGTSVVGTTLTVTNIPGTLLFNGTVQ